MYAVDVVKRSVTYRLEPDLLAIVAVKAAERGDTVTDAVAWGLEAYIRRDEAAEIAPQAPPIAATVHTPVWEPASDEELPAEPAAVACRHPAEAVDAGECRLCGADVW